jgi:hypothetical protein
MADARYTIVCEFRGGTYVSQVHADDEVEAVRRWAERIKAEKPIPGASPFVARNVLRDLDDMPPTPLRGLTSVWCLSFSVADSFGWCNVVRSD